MSILIGIHIQRRLKSVTKIDEVVGGRVYPVAIPQGAPKYPFVAYTIGDIVPSYTKDGKNEDEASVAIQICAKTYTQATLLANDVRYALEDFSCDYPDIKLMVNDCEMVGYSEGYNDDLPCFTSTLEMRFKTNDY